MRTSTLMLVLMIVMLMGTVALGLRLDTVAAERDAARAELAAWTIEHISNRALEPQPIATGSWSLGTDLCGTCGHDGVCRTCGVCNNYGRCLTAGSGDRHGRCATCGQ